MRILVSSAFVLSIALAQNPASAEDPAKPQPDEIVPYKQIDDVELTLHFFRPNDHSADDQRAAIIFFFGGGWNGGSPSQFYSQSRRLASQGMISICADYRTKSKHGTDPRACVRDGKSAIRWVRTRAKELGIDPEKILAGGGSAGGHVAAATAAVDQFNEADEDTSVSCQSAALVLFNPVFDNSSKGYGYSRVKDYWKAFSPMHNLDADIPPTLVLLGTKDNLIPVETAESFQKKMTKLGVRCDLELYEDQPHGFFNKAKYDETLARMEKFLTSLGYLK